MVEKLYAGRGGRPAENFALLDNKYAFLRMIYSLTIFSIGYIKTPCGDAPNLVPFSAFLVDETYILYKSLFTNKW